MDLYIDGEVLEKYLKLNDDDRCLCGSGKLFKDCHKVDLTYYEDINKYQIYRHLKKIKESKLCFCRNEHCNDVYTFSHSIPKSSLNNISEDGHIYKFDIPTPKDSKQLVENYCLEPVKKGIKETSCYYGFCNFHDTTIFYPIEREEIVPTAKQLLLTRYRAITKEIYTKCETTKVIPITNKVIDSRKTRKEKIMFAAFHAQFSSGTYRSLEEYYKELEKCRKGLFGTNRIELQYLLFVFDDRFPVQCCSFVNPVYSPYGTKINDYNDFVKDSEFFSLYSFYNNGKTYIILTWEKDSIVEIFLRELVERIKGKECNYLIQLIFSFSENHAFSISWWNSLSVIKKKRLMQLFYQDVVNSQEYHNPFEDFRNLRFSDSKMLSFYATF